MNYFIIVIVFVVVLYFLYNQTEHYEPGMNGEPCIKGESGKLLCQDCQYPIDCHGPNKGQKWRHIFS
jgi:hypothetical protein